MLLGALLQGDTAERRRPEIGPGTLDCEQRAEELVAWLPPLRDEGAVGDLFADEPVVLFVCESLVFESF